jgi:phenylpyruvate tautomerase PptA (4-oxalocrotonate tautomerase family)
MALVRIEVIAGRSAEEKRDLLAAVHDSLVSCLHVPPGDPVLRIVEHAPEDFQRPTVPHPTTERFTLVEITMFASRSNEAKSSLYQDLVERLGGLRIPAKDVTIVLIESPLCNWGVHGGRPASEVDLGFDVEI